MVVDYFGCPQCPRCHYNPVNCEMCAQISRASIFLKASTNITENHIRTSSSSNNDAVSLEFSQVLNQVDSILSQLEEREKAMWWYHSTFNKLAHGMICVQVLCLCIQENHTLLRCVGVVLKLIIQESHTWCCWCGVETWHSRKSHMVKFVCYMDVVLKLNIQEKHVGLLVHCVDVVLKLNIQENHTYYLCCFVWVVGNGFQSTFRNITHGIFVLHGWEGVVLVSQSAIGSLLLHKEFFHKCSSLMLQERTCNPVSRRIFFFG